MVSQPHCLLCNYWNIDNQIKSFFFVFVLQFFFLNLRVLYMIEVDDTYETKRMK